MGFCLLVVFFSNTIAAIGRLCKFTYIVPTNIPVCMCLLACYCMDLLSLPAQVQEIHIHSCSGVMKEETGRDESPLVPTVEMCKRES